MSSLINARGIIASIEQAKSQLDGLGAVYRGEFSFKDIIYQSSAPLNEDFVCMRIYSQTNWDEGDVVVQRKKTEWIDRGKIDHDVLKKGFDSEEEALDYIAAHCSDFKRSFEFSRVGWEYSLPGYAIFVEGVEGYPPSVEIKAEDAASLQDMLQQLHVTDIIRDSMAEAMRKILKH